MHRQVYPDEGSAVRRAGFSTAGAAWAGANKRSHLKEVSLDTSVQVHERQQAAPAQQQAVCWRRRPPVLRAHVHAAAVAGVCVHGGLTAAAEVRAKAVAGGPRRAVQVARARRLAGQACAGPLLRQRAVERGGREMR